MISKNSQQIKFFNLLNDENQIWRSSFLTQMATSQRLWFLQSSERESITRSHWFRHLMSCSN